MAGTAIALGVTLTGLGVACLFLGVLSAVRSFGLYRRGIRTAARVVAYDGDGEGRRPVIEFQDRTSRMRRVRLPWGGGEPPLGGSVRVVCSRDDPGRVRVDSFFGLWAVAVTLVFAGAILLLFGLSVLSGMPAE
jgi:hypothetical protein